MAMRVCAWFDWHVAAKRHAPLEGKMWREVTLKLIPLAAQR